MPDGARSPDRPHRGARARAGDALVVPRLRDERDRRPRAARRPRRPEAGPPPRPLRDARPRPAADPRRTASAPSSSARSWASTTPTATRRSTTRWCGWRRTSPCATRWSTARATSARSTTTRPPPCGTPRRASTRLATEMLRDIDADTVDFGPNYDESHAGAAGPAGALPEPAGQRRLRASRSAWRPTSRRTTCARSPARSPPTSTTREIDLDGPDGARQGPGLPGRRHHEPRGASATPTRPAAAASRSAPAPTSSRCKGGKEAIIVTELPFTVKKGGDGGLIDEDRRPRPRQEARGDLRPARRVRPHRHAPRDRAEARRAAGQGRAQQPLQEDRDADDLRHQHGRAGRRRPEDARACAS